ncbi:TetR family transcriptional regulator [Gryllotalpicola ginsengisoli]|uniref:TetR family transcriptional regulator n=1 Tax=Gryllotalpicola ginsengisoli TaxID=444608 RepID=UPI0003B6039F|nr:TetR family transcriptional regulator [Gryllotalpicola ginsengisoli]
MTDLKEPGLRERKRAATRRAIEREALRLALDSGLENVTVDEIAEAADVSPRTFFNYFPTKEAAVIGSDPIGPDEAEIEAFVHGGPDQPVLDGVRLLLASVVASKGADEAREIRELQSERMKLMLKYPHLFRQRMENMEELTQKVIGMVERRLVTDVPELAEDRSELHSQARLVVFVAFAGMRHAWASWAENDGKGELADCLKHSFDQLHALARVNV